MNHNFICILCKLFLSLWRVPTRKAVQVFDGALCTIATISYPSRTNRCGNCGPCWVIAVKWGDKMVLDSLIAQIIPAYQKQVTLIYDIKSISPQPLFIVATCQVRMTGVLS